MNYWREEGGSEEKDRFDIYQETEIVGEENFSPTLFFV